MLPARIQTLLARNRAFGSRDRRLYRELIYTTLRFLPWIEPLLDSAPEEAVRRVALLASDVPATTAFRREFATGEPPEGDRAELLPAWFRAHCAEIFSGAELDAQLRRASLWLRLQTDDAPSVFAEFDDRGWRWQRSEILPRAVELLAEADVTQTDAWEQGRIEVQDIGSQLILESAGVTLGERWLDACAGAGGKTLQLAALLGRTGHVDAYDIRPAALTELETRARRAALPNITIARTPPAKIYDGVLVDAPCSGSGTWRRSPHLKWTTTESQLARAAETQRALLQEFSARVRPGGRLIYATCSLSHVENEDVVTGFLAAHPEFRAEPPERAFDATSRSHGLAILPAQHNSDGFFVASLRRA